MECKAFNFVRACIAISGIGIYPEWNVKKNKYGLTATIVTELEYIQNGM